MIEGRASSPGPVALPPLFSIDRRSGDRPRGCWRALASRSKCLEDSEPCLCAEVGRDFSKPGQNRDIHYECAYTRILAFVLQPERGRLRTVPSVRGTQCSERAAHYVRVDSESP